MLKLQRSVREKIDIYDINKNEIIEMPVEDVIYKLYYLKVRPATQEELDKHNSKYTAEQIKQIISETETDIPLYDVFTQNIYIVQKRNVYQRVTNNHYRFPDELLLESIVKDKKKLEAKLKKFPEKKNDGIFQNKLNKKRLMLEFMSYFDIQKLYDTYSRVFLLYAPEIGNKTYTCIRKSFIPHNSHLLPYYTKDEVIRLAMNNSLIEIPHNTSYDDFKDSISSDSYVKLCKKIQANDISAAILMKHQNYIIDNNSVGLIQYYTVQGAYFINQYMRKMTPYPYKNDYLEEIIEKMWRLVLGAPAFDNDYTLYRFVSDDSYLQHLEVGDIFVEQGFTSTTRDPFYKTGSYNFGFILIKIKIPKGVKGVGLCLETLSHFAVEEEIILAPFAKLRLVAITNASDYYHPNKDFVSEVKKGYVFEWVSNTEKIDRLPFPRRIEFDGETKIIDFLKIEKSNSYTMKEKTSFLMSKYFDVMNRAKCKIGDNVFYVIGEYYNSMGAYKDMYAISTSEGFSLYAIYNGYLLFMIELGDEEGSQMRVNFFSKYSELKRDAIMGDNNFINFLCSVAMYFNIAMIIIYADYYSCDHMERETDTLKKNKNNNDNDNENIDRDNLNRSTFGCTLCGVRDLEHKKRKQKGGDIKGTIEEINKNDINNKRKFRTMKVDEHILNKIDINRRLRVMRDKNIKQRGLEDKNSKKTLIFKDEKDEKDENEEDEENSTNMKSNKGNKEYDNTYIDDDADLEYTGGSYCVDFYRYLKYGTKRYKDVDTFNIELKPKFDYRDLDRLKEIKPTDILRINDRDELYQIYKRAYLGGEEANIEKHNLANFYIWMIENKCYMMDILVSKFDRVYKDRNPFKRGYYILDAMTYIYNRHKNIHYNRNIRMDFDEEYQQLVLPKNDYRIVRSTDAMIKR